MSYRFFPPGPVYFWHFGSYGPYIRWILSATAILVLSVIWYGALHRPLLNYCTPTNCTAQWASVLAELAAADNTTNLITSQYDVTTTMLEILNRYDATHLTIQSCTCQKPSTKDGITTQRICYNASGTIEQLHNLLVTLATITIPIRSADMTLKQQNANNYTIISNYECIII